MDLGKHFLTFTRKKTYWRSISVSLNASGLKNNLSCDNGVYSISIPFYEPGQINAAWSDPAVAHRLFDYFIDTYNPPKMHCLRELPNSQNFTTTKLCDWMAQLYERGESCGDFYEDGKSRSLSRGDIVETRRRCFGPVRPEDRRGT